MVHGNRITICRTKNHQRKNEIYASGCQSELHNGSARKRHNQNPVCRRPLREIEIGIDCSFRRKFDRKISEINLEDRNRRHETIAIFASHEIVVRQYNQRRIHKTAMDTAFASVIKSSAIGIELFTLDNLAKMADKMWEVSDRFCVASVENEKKSSMEKIVEALEKLTNPIGALERGEHKSRPDVTPSQNRAKSRQRSKSEQNTEHEYCWFHYKYGDKAQKCREPCK